MPDDISLSWGDYSQEVSSFRVRGVTLTAANFVAQAALRNSLSTACVAVLAGQVQRMQVTVIDAENPAWPSDPVAQREMKWLVTYTGANGKTYRCELPTADIAEAGLLSVGTDLWDESDPDWVQFITDFEAVVVDEAEGAVTITEVRFVGRNT